MKTPTGTIENDLNIKPAIRVNLSNSSNSKAFGDKEQIHYYEFKKAVCWINQHIERIRIEEKERGCVARSKKATERCLNTISILGSRGSGKTSFLLSLLHQYRVHPDVQVLDVLDPTLIEEKGHIFLSVISQITDLVDRALDATDCRPECPQYATREVWRHKLKTLSSGLPSVEEAAHYDSSWQDPDYIMDKGLRAVHAARKLEQNFHELVEMSLQILGKKAYLLSLDDIDVDFKKGWPVLETLRKYLTTSRIITLISGDIDLFSKAIRKQQWKNFGKALLINEAENQGKYPEYNDLVTEMEGQYLQKVLKPEYRIHLNTLLEQIDTMGLDIRIEYRDEEGHFLSEKSIQEAYQENLALFGIHNLSQSEAFVTYLLSLPLRTQVQFLSQFSNLRSGYAVEVTDPFLSDLYEKQVNVDLAKNMPKMLTVVILQLLLNNKVLSEVYQLQPTTSDQSLNSCVTALSLLFAQKVKQNPYLIFDYIIKIGYVRNLHSLLGYEDEKGKTVVSSTTPSINGLCTHAQIFQDKVLRDVTGNITAYLRGFLEYKSNRGEMVLPVAGTMVLKGFYSNARKDPQGRIDYIFGDTVTPQSCIAYIPLSVSSYAMKNTTLLTYSVYGLLATISDLIKEKKNLKESLVNFSQIRSYVMPNFEKDIVEREVGNAGEEESNKLSLRKYDDLSLLEEMIREWIDLYTLKEVSPYLLGKIATRFFYALDNMEQANRFSTLGEAMSRSIFALLNAILLEDVKENYKPSSENTEVTVSNLNLNNIQTSSRIFFYNLGIAGQLKGDFSLSNWLMSCPLLLFFLPNEEVKSILRQTEYPYSTSPLRYNIYDLLQKVELRSTSAILKNPLVKEQDKPVFSGSKRNVLKTIEVLKNFDPDSYNYISKHSPRECEEKYGHLFSNTIYPTSIKALLDNMDTSVPFVKKWMNNQPDSSLEWIDVDKEK